MNLRSQILKELREASTKEKNEIKKCKEKISTEMFLSSTVSGGAFSTLARNACEESANSARQRMEKLEAENKWKSKMLNKYQRGSGEKENG